MRLRHAQLPFAHLWLPASCGEHFLYKTGFLSVVRIIMLRLFNYMAHVSSSAPPNCCSTCMLASTRRAQALQELRCPLLAPPSSEQGPGRARMARRHTCSGKLPGGQSGPLQGCAGPEGSAGRKMGEEAANIQPPANSHLLPCCCYSEYLASS